MFYEQVLNFSVQFVFSLILVSKACSEDQAVFHCIESNAT